MKKTPLRKAVSICSPFTVQHGEDSRTVLENVRVGPARVEGTNGHILMIVPIDPVYGITDDVLLSPDEVYLLSRDVSEDQPALHGVTMDGFPHTEKVSELCQTKPVTCTVYVNPDYLRRIGEAFDDLNVHKVKIEIRGDMEPIKITAKQDGQEVAQAFLMPMRD